MLIIFEEFIMNLYTTMHKEFESNKDLIEFSNKYKESIDRFLMIRSMNKNTS